MTALKTTELYVVYSKTQYNVSRPYKDLAFTSKEEAEDIITPLKQGYPENDYVIGTIDDWTDDYGDARWNDGIATESENNY